MHGSENKKEKTKISKEELVELLRLETVVAKYRMGLNYRLAFYQYLIEEGFERDEALKAVKYIWDEA